MEHPLRSVVKAVTWQILGLATMTGLAYVATGNLATSGGLALSAAAISFIFFVLHERIWAHVGWGRRKS